MYEDQRRGETREHAEQTLKSNTRHTTYSMSPASALIASGNRGAGSMLVEVVPAPVPDIRCQPADLELHSSSASFPVPVCFPATINSLLGSNRPY